MKNTFIVLYNRVVCCASSPPSPERAVFPHVHCEEPTLCSLMTLMEVLTHTGSS